MSKPKSFDSWTPEKQEEWLEKRRAKQRARYATNPKSILERNRKRYAANIDKAREIGRNKARNQYLANPEKFRERARKRRAANPENTRKQHSKAKAANPEKFRERARKWRAANPALARKLVNQWRAANLVKIKAESLKRVSLLQDSYIASKLRLPTAFLREHLPHLLSVKRKQIQAQRHIKQTNPTKQ
jgi:hypothetical protein